MLWLSEVLIEHHELECFGDLVEAVKQHAKAGERFFRIDVRPPFDDTPENWEERLETAFTGSVG